jgi:chemotaxis protein CheX
MSSKAPFIVVKPSTEWAGYVQDALHEVFEMMLGMQSAPAEDVAIIPEITSIVGLAGSLCGLFSIRCSRATAVKLATRMLGIEPNEKAGEVMDALGEICNMVAGSFKSRIQGIADTCMLSVPTTISGEDYHVHPLRGGQRYEMFFQCEDCPMQIILHVNN